MQTQDTSLSPFPIIQDYSIQSEFPDYVYCSNCGVHATVDCGTHECPVCHKDALQDIRQEASLDALDSEGYTIQHHGWHAGIFTIPKEKPQ